MADERLPQRAAELREQGRRRRWRPILRLKDCVKIDVKKREGRLEEVDRRQRRVKKRSR